MLIKTSCATSSLVYLIHGHLNSRNTVRGGLTGELIKQVNFRHSFIRYSVYIYKQFVIVVITAITIATATGTPISIKKGNRHSYNHKYSHPHILGHKQIHSLMKIKPL